MGSQQSALLVNPMLTDTQYWAEWSLPQGLLRIASSLRKKGYRLHLIDCMETDAKRRVPQKMVGRIDVGGVQVRIHNFGLTLEQFDERLKQVPFTPHEVYVTSMMTYWWKSTRDVIKLIKKRFPKAVVKLGGVYPTLCSDHAKRFSGADEICAGTMTSAMDEWVDLSLYEKPPPYSIIVSSRGCPYNCSYCAQRALNGPKTHFRDPGDILDEMACKYEAGIREFAFYVDNLLMNRAHFEAVLDGIVERKLRVRIFAPAGIEPWRLDVDLLMKMKKAGWKKIHLGFETISDKNKNDWNRTHALIEDYMTAVEACEKAGFRLRSEQVNAFILYGLPDESLEDVVNSILFASHINGSVIPMLFTPVPGSELFKKFEPYLKEKFPDEETGEIDYTRLNGKLFPFLDYNGERYGYSIRDYIDLQRLMFASNIQFRSQSFDFLGSGLISRSFREQIGNPVLRAED